MRTRNSSRNPESRHRTADPAKNANAFAENRSETHLISFVSVKPAANAFAVWGNYV